MGSQDTNADSDGAAVDHFSEHLTRPIASDLIPKELSNQRVGSTYNSEEQILTKQCELRTNQK